MLVKIMFFLSNYQICYNPR